MTELQQQRSSVQQLRRLLRRPDLVPDIERPEILKILRRAQIRLVLLLHREDLQGLMGYGFDPQISRKLDAIEVLLER